MVRLYHGCTRAKETLTRRLWRLAGARQALLRAAVYRGASARAAKRVNIYFLARKIIIVVKRASYQIYERRGDEASIQIRKRYV
jgi:hypothetical protein